MKSKLPPIDERIVVMVKEEAIRGKASAKAEILHVWCRWCTRQWKLGRRALSIQEIKSETRHECRETLEGGGS